jgi:hypothetical protein
MVLDANIADQKVKRHMVSFLLHALRRLLSCASVGDPPGYNLVIIMTKAQAA